MARQDAPKEVDDIGYEAASLELDRILVELDDESIDIDHLADRVRRAAELIASCRRRIAAARLDVDQVVATLADAPSTTAAPTAAPTADQP